VGPECSLSVRSLRGRPDGWLEVALGDLYIGGYGIDVKVTIFLMEIGNYWKRGLIVQGIELRLEH
jgi:Phloem protein 2